MTKAKNNKFDLGIVFWVIFAGLFIWIGVGGVKVNYVNRVDRHASWVVPIGLIIFGGMILGVAINKLSVSVLKGKNGKDSK